MIYYAIYPAADPIPPAQDIIDGVVPNSVSFSVASPIETSLGFTTEQIQGLSSATDYKISAVDDSGPSNVATSPSFSTLTVTNVITFDKSQVVYRPNKVTIEQPGFSGYVRIYWAVYPADQEDPTAEEIVFRGIPNALYLSDLAPLSDTDDFVGSVFSDLNLGNRWKLAAVASNATDYSNVVITDDLNVAFVEKVLTPSRVVYATAAFSLGISNTIGLAPIDLVYSLTKIGLPSNQTVTLKPAKIIYQLNNVGTTTQDWIPIVPNSSVWQKVGT